MKFLKRIQIFKYQDSFEPFDSGNLSFFVIKNCGSNLFIGRWFHILVPSFMVTTDNQVGPKYITQGNLIGLEGKAPRIFSKSVKSGNLKKSFLEKNWKE